MVLMRMFCLVVLVHTAILAGLILINTKASSGLACLECPDVPNARDCDTVKECGPHEQCSSKIVGKRSMVRESGDLPVCDGCCNSLWCQAKLCQDVDYVTGRGPICFNCEDQIPEENCTHIKECSRDEVCFESYKRSPSGHVLRQTGCFGKLMCDRVSASTHFNPTNETCWNCCHDDVCNTRCDHKATIKPSQASVVVAPTSAAPCVDSTPQATCKLAASIVCTDISHAQNANCMHYCGYC